MTSEILHDAQSGFHDIKPPSRFDPALPLWPWYIAAVLLAIAVFWRVWKHWKASKSLQTVPVIDPLADAVGRLRRLSSSTWNSEPEFRALVVESSLAFRNALEALLRIPAPELTVTELQQELPSALHCLTDTKPDTQRIQMERSLVALLQWYERNTYSSAAESDSASSLRGKNSAAISFIEELSQALSPSNSSDSTAKERHAI